MSRSIIYEVLASTVGKPIANWLATGNPIFIFGLLVIGAGTGGYFGWQAYQSASPLDKEHWAVAPYIFGIVGAFAGAILGALVPIGRRPKE